MAMRPGESSTIYGRDGISKAEKSFPNANQGEDMQRLKSGWLKGNVAMIAAVVVIASGVAVSSMAMQELKPFDAPKTEPPIITPGRTPSDAPSDAIVLFDGKDLSAWRS